jgi:hypothetical protein
MKVKNISISFPGIKCGWLREKGSRYGNGTQLTKNTGAI